MDQIIAMIQQVKDTNDFTRQFARIDTDESQKFSSLLSSNAEDIMNSLDYNVCEGSAEPSTADELKGSNYKKFVDQREQKLNDKIEFVKIVKKHKQILFCECDGIEITPRSKEDAWKAVAAEVEMLGLESFKGKRWARLRDHDWQYVRRHAISRSDHVNKPFGKLGELDSLVMEIVNSTSQSMPPSISSDETVKKFVKSVAYTEQSTNLTQESSNDSSSVQKDPSHLKTEECDNFFDMLQQVSKIVPTTTASLVPIIPTSVGPETSFSPRRDLAPIMKAPTSAASSSVSPIEGPRPKRLRSSPVEKNHPTILTMEERREQFESRKMELELRRMELINEKIQKEIEMMKKQQDRLDELHVLLVKEKCENFIHTQKLTNTSMSK